MRGMEALAKAVAGRRAPVLGVRKDIARCGSAQRRRMRSTPTR
jgi:hypothetical protein